MRPLQARALAFALLLFITAACGNSSDATPNAIPPGSVDPVTASTVTGHVRFDGTAPPAQFLRIDGDRNCVTLNGRDTIPSERVVVGEEQALANVFVYVKSGLEAYRFRPPGEPAVLDQQGCRYIPRVIGVMVGQPLEVRNSDPLLHNVRGEGAVNQPFNMGQPVQGTRFSRTFTTREVMVPFTCDVHAWMNAYIGVLEHPFHTVTGTDGAFALSGLPPGTYTLEAWHETLGARTETVTLGPKETKDVAFTFAD
jgi:hypothetical protein